jgi:hypothetical protein
MGYQLIDPGILFMGVSLSILLTCPKAQCQNLVLISIGYQNNLIHETGLALQYGQDLFLNSFGQLPCFPFFGIDGDDSTEHNIPPVGNCLSGKDYSSTDSRVNCRKMVQVIYRTFDDYAPANTLAQKGVNAD